MTTPTSTPALSTMLYLLDDAFDSTTWHSLVRNLESVREDDWLWVPPDGRRSIRDIVQHVGGSKLLYQNHAFGSATLHWTDPIAEGVGRIDTLPSAIEWLRECQTLLRGSIASLQSDEELLRPRPNFRGVLKETRWLITVMIGHDFYHAGEINHIRCLHQGDDE